MKDLTICAVGDVRIDYEKTGRPDPEAAFALCAHVFQGADINFFNCEGVYTDLKVTVPAQHMGSSSSPKNFRAMKWAGFNVCSLANNHSFDRGAEGLIDTLELAHSHGIKTCGAGRNIKEARTPAIMERNGARVGFLAYNCVGPVEYAARAERAGDAPMKVSTVYQAVEYQPGTPCKVLTFADPDDFAALKADIAKLRPDVDLLVVNFHWGMHHVQAMIHMYQQQIAHAVIDAGADLVLGGHDHVVKGMEMYRGKAVFYGMGDFLVDQELGENVKTAWRQMKHQMYDLKYDHDYPTYPFAGEARHHLIVKCRVEGGRIVRVSYLPCTINKQGQTYPLKAGDPKFDEVTSYFDAISRHQGFNVKLAREGDEIVVSDPGGESRPIRASFTKFIMAPIETAAAADGAAAAH